MKQRSLVSFFSKPKASPSGSASLKAQKPAKDQPLVIPRAKRVRETHHEDEVMDKLDDNPPEHKVDETQEKAVKRQKLLEALGADDFINQGAWAEVRARFDWLDPAKIRDGQRRRPGEPGYDPRTVYLDPTVMSRMSSSQQTYWNVKKNYMDTVLFYKVGSFYELYELDAEIGQREFNWKMIVSGVGRCRQVGVPASGIEDAVRGLVARGYKVGRIEQMETGAQAKARGGKSALVKRELVRVETPATQTEGILRPDAIHLLALQEEPLLPAQTSPDCILIGFAFVDAAAGRFYTGSFKDDESRAALGALLAQVSPQEVLYEPNSLTSETRKAFRRCSTGPLKLPLQLTPLPEFLPPQTASQELARGGYFRTQGESLKSEKAEKAEPAVSAIWALITYLKRLKVDLELLSSVELLPYEVYSGSLRLDGRTLTNLELVESLETKSQTGTLLGHLDHCSTAFGKRLLRRWICHPLRSITEINARQEAVEELFEKQSLGSLLRERLKRVPDIERLIARVKAMGGPKGGAMVLELASKQGQLRQIQTFCTTIKALRTSVSILSDLHDHNLQSPLLQHLASTANNPLNNTLLSDLESAFETPPPNLKKPSLPQLKKPEKDQDPLEVLGNLIHSFLDHNLALWGIQLTEALGRLDVLLAFATAARTLEGPTCRPQFVSSRGTLELEGLWHPYAVGGGEGAIVPNDVMLGGKGYPRAMLLTGPNMGGKSTLLRATCLATIMAQLGCRVPAQQCRLSPVDTIFTRLGASDRIMAGESTFFVECNEAAAVLRHATPDSLVVLDELGRGTSTFDGYAIAHAVLQHLTQTLDCRLLFATHYHSLTTEFASAPGVQLCHMASALRSPLGMCQYSEEHKEEENWEANAGGILDKELVFLYKLKDGSSPKSYGLQVAHLAGIPYSIVQAAAKAAAALEEKLQVAFVKSSQASSLLAEGELAQVRSLCAYGKQDNQVTIDGYKALVAMWRTAKKVE